MSFSKLVFCTFSNNQRHDWILGTQSGPINLSQIQTGHRFSACCILVWISNCLYHCYQYIKEGTVIFFSASSTLFVVYPMRREHFHSNTIPHLWISGINAKESAASRVSNLPALPRRLSAHFAFYSVANAPRLQDNISGSRSTRLISTAP
jgi:hypothetical protein